MGHAKKCQFCHSEFTATRSDARTCGSKCRVGLARQRILRGPTQPSNDVIKPDAEASVRLIREQVAPQSRKTFDVLLDRAAKIYCDKLLAEFDQALNAKQDLVNNELALAKAERDAAATYRLGVDSHMTREEFRLVLSCLRPDKHREDAARFSRAFSIFNRLEKTVNDKLPISVLRERGWETKSPFYKPSRG